MSRCSHILILFFFAPNLFADCKINNKLTGNESISINFICENIEIDILCKSESECDVIASEELSKYNYKFLNGKLTKTVATEYLSSSVTHCQDESRNQLLCEKSLCKNNSQQLTNKLSEYEIKKESCNLNFKSCIDSVKISEDIIRNQCVSEGISSLESNVISKFCLNYTRFLKTELMDGNTKCLMNLKKGEKLINEPQERQNFLVWLNEQINEDLKSVENNCKLKKKLLSSTGKLDIEKYICLKSAEAGYIGLKCISDGGIFVSPSAKSKTDAGDNASNLSAGVAVATSAKAVEVLKPDEFNRQVPISNMVADIRKIESDPNLSAEVKTSQINNQLDGFFSNFSPILDSTRRMFNNISFNNTDNIRNNVNRNEGDKKSRIASTPSGYNKRDISSISAIGDSKLQTSAALPAAKVGDISKVSRVSNSRSPKTTALLGSGGATNDAISVSSVNSGGGNSSQLSALGGNISFTPAEIENRLNNEDKTLIAEVLNEQKNPTAADIISVYYQDKIKDNSGFKEIFSILDSSSSNKLSTPLSSKLLLRFKSTGIKIIDSTRKDSQIIVDIRNPNYVIFKTADGFRITQPAKVKNEK